MHQDRPVISLALTLSGTEHQRNPRSLPEPQILGRSQHSLWSLNRCPEARKKQHQALTSVPRLSYIPDPKAKFQPCSRRTGLGQVTSQMLHLRLLATLHSCVTIFISLGLQKWLKGKWDLVRLMVSGGFSCTQAEVIVCSSHPGQEGSTLVVTCTTCQLGPVFQKPHCDTSRRTSIHAHEPVGDISHPDPICVDLGRPPCPGAFTDTTKGCDRVFSSSLARSPPSASAVSETKIEN